jgi:hypothetical protein
MPASNPVINWNTIATAISRQSIVRGEPLLGKNYHRGIYAQSENGEGVSPGVLLLLASLDGALNNRKGCDESERVTHRLFSLSNCRGCRIRRGNETTFHCLDGRGLEDSAIEAIRVE